MLRRECWPICITRRIALRLCFERRLIRLSSGRTWLLMWIRLFVRRCCCSSLLYSVGLLGLVAALH
ncbi:hypothetical protein BJX99DRAFT_223577 [Aspergillus californicus]